MGDKNELRKKLEEFFKEEEEHSGLENIYEEILEQLESINFYLYLYCLGVYSGKQYVLAYFGYLYEHVKTGTAEKGLIELTVDKDWNISYRIVEREKDRGGESYTKNIESALIDIAERHFGCDVYNILWIDDFDEVQRKVEDLIKKLK